MVCSNQLEIKWNYNSFFVVFKLQSFDISIHENPCIVCLYSVMNNYYVWYYDINGTFLEFYLLTKFFAVKPQIPFNLRYAAHSVGMNLRLLLY